MIKHPIYEGLIDRNAYLYNEEDEEDYFHGKLPELSTMSYYRQGHHCCNIDDFDHNKYLPKKKIRIYVLNSFK